LIIFTVPIYTIISVDQEMNNSQFAQERPTQNYGAPPTPQQNGQHNTSSNSK